MENIKDFTLICYYITHPKAFFLMLWNFSVDASYWICLYVALFSLICYIFNFKKFAKYVPFSVGFYALIQSIGSAFK